VKQAMVDYMKKDKFDRFDTPAYAVRPLLPYIKKTWTVWEPTDSGGAGKITELLAEHGCDVIATGKKQLDFLEDEPDLYFDCIVTNPPYSLKDEFILRCLEHNKPFALLMPLTTLEGVARGDMFRRMQQDFGVLVLDRRVEFTGGSVWFNTSWFCRRILPRQLMFAELKKEENACNTK
jgi:hypothetical protein